MARTKRKVKRLETIWECPDDLWDNFIEPVLAERDPRKPGAGRKRIDPRKALNGMIYQMRTGCQWNVLPKRFGDDTSVHRTLQRWIERGVFETIWAELIEHCDDLGGVEWQWQSADAAMGKARLGGPDRPEPDGSGEKRHEKERDRRRRRRSAGRGRGRCQRA